MGDVRDKLFISYSHHDESWLNRFMTMLAPIKNAGNLRLWSDKEIKSGDNWQDELDKALNTAKAALLLVSPDFLASQYICESELPHILDDPELNVYWALVAPALIPEALKKRQAAHAIDKSLLERPYPEQMRIIRDICHKIEVDFGQYNAIEMDSRSRLRRDVEKALDSDVRLGAEVSAGDFSIVYFASSRHDEHDLVVKAIVNSPLDDWAIKILDDHVQKAHGLSHASFIKTYEARLKDRPPMLIMDKINGPTLKQVLQRKGALPPDRVVHILCQIAGALTDAHRNKLLYGSLRPSSLFLLEEDVLKLSVVDLCNELLLSGRMRGSIFTSYDMMNYMTPELYYGGCPSDKSDQYYLGLLALEMLNGEPPVAVTCVADLEKKRSFFDEPRKCFGEWQTMEPGLAPIIARALQKKPENRWQSMEMVASKLLEVREQRWHENIIKTSYATHCQDKWDFYRMFYKKFFEKQPDWSQYFNKHKIDMTHQYNMLDQAVALLTNFHFGPEPTALSHVARVHAKLGLGKEQYAKFVDSFMESICAMGEKDEDTQRAWRWLFGHGTEYLLQAAAGAPQAQPAA
jgi:serine/threonine protein kinase